MRRSFFCVLVLVFGMTGCATAQSPERGNGRPWSVRMADSVMARHPDPVSLEGGSRKLPKWSYSTAFLIHAIAQAGVEKDQAKYIDYAKQYMDAFLDASGRITTPTYGPDEQTLDDIEPGRLLFLLLEETGEARYRTTIDLLAAQLKKQPRTSDGGFWHKKIYPQQMWLDGIFMACPFMVEYGKLTNAPSWHNEAAKQILLIAKHTRDAKTGLFYHGWDASRQQPWADEKTGLSQCVWGRAMGWYAMGIVETLEELPPDHPKRGELIELLNSLADAVAKVQDPKSGVWYQVLDQQTREGNYLESSASAMFVYAFSKGTRLGLLDKKHEATVRKGWDGLLKQFIETHADGTISLTDTCQVAGLGGRTKRDGSFEYYMSEPRVSNDPKALAPFILAAMEMERKARRHVGT